jgi:hypothetical protein
VTPTLMRPDRWRAFVMDPRAIRSGDVRLGQQGAIDLASTPRDLDDPAVRVALTTCAGRVAASFDRYMFAEVRPSGDGGRTVLLRDARFAGAPGPYGFATTPVVLASDLTPAPDARPCPLLGRSW